MSFGFFFLHYHYKCHASLFLAYFCCYKLMYPRPLRARPASAHFKSFLWLGRGRREPWLSTSGCCASRGCAPRARGCWGPGSASPGFGRKRGCGASVLSGTRPWRRGTGQSPGRGSWGSFRASLGADRAQAGRSSAAPPPPGGARQGVGTPPRTWHSGNRKCWPGPADWWLQLVAVRHPALTLGSGPGL